ncbi:MAG TPA: NAD(P)/FAD-dependent oxidoreductase [Bryobacteraceae bacterium]|nr:NAD(P)/FAD-dependent oxidoreductase [Bryobacteraceae bacterium]
MGACGVLIAGGGPAGSSCAWALRHSGLDVAILDQQTFPRDKVCGGWITPAVLTELEIDAADYTRGRVFQPITAFRTGCIGGSALETNYRSPASYGIRRREFDDYLLKRSGARMLPAAKLETLERCADGWVVNGQMKAQLVVGAGGHFCPVAKLIAAKPAREDAVVAQEAEFEMDAAQQAACRVRPEMPELYFCRDMKGYGWCFRKGNFLNVGLGRMDQHRLSGHVAGFLKFLKDTGRVTFDIPAPLGHAYLLYGVSERKVCSDGVLLIGDSAGLAYKQSGEGIRPAIESGLLAARTILAAQGDYSERALQPYRAALAARFGKSGSDLASRLGAHLPSSWTGGLGRLLLSMPWFVRSFVIERWFLHTGDAPLVPDPGVMAAEVQRQLA